MAQALEAIRRRRAQARSVVGLCPSSLLEARDPEGYTALFAALAATLASAGDLVVLFPHATLGRAGAGMRSNDLHTIERVLQALPASVRTEAIAIEGDVHAVELLELLGALDLAVVSRFHAMVGALSVGLPPVVVGWGHKYREVMEEVGLGEHALDAGETTPARVMTSLDAIRGDRDGHRARVTRRLEAIGRSALTQIEHAAQLAGAARP